jgi:hypothetical protein
VDVKSDSEAEVGTMHYCDYCGEEILGTPYRRRRHDYCSRSCADDHEFEMSEAEDEEEELLEAEEDEEAY